MVPDETGKICYSSCSVSGGGVCLQVGHGSECDSGCVTELGGACSSG